jgi:hypothetical protein
MSNSSFFFGKSILGAPSFVDMVPEDEEEEQTVSFNSSTCFGSLLWAESLKLHKEDASWQGSLRQGSNHTRQPVSCPSSASNPGTFSHTVQSFDQSALFNLHDQWSSFPPLLHPETTQRMMTPSRPRQKRHLRAVQASQPVSRDVSLAPVSARPAATESKRQRSDLSNYHPSISIHTAMSNTLSWGPSHDQAQLQYPTPAPSMSSDFESPVPNVAVSPPSQPGGIPTTSSGVHDHQNVVATPESIQRLSPDVTEEDEAEEHLKNRRLAGFRPRKDYRKKVPAKRQRQE